MLDFVKSLSVTFLYPIFIRLFIAGVAHEQR
jgi:hypothetical protein